MLPHPPAAGRGVRSVAEMARADRAPPPRPGRAAAGHRRRHGHGDDTGSRSPSGAGRVRPSLRDVDRNRPRPPVSPRALMGVRGAGRAGRGVGRVAARLRYLDHRTRWVGAPPGACRTPALERLLAPNEKLTRKRVTLIYRPYDAAEAAAIADRDVRTATGQATATPPRSDRRDSAALQAARQSAREQGRRRRPRSLVFAGHRDRR
jgi:hypothetical protein